MTEIYAKLVHQETILFEISPENCSLFPFFLGGDRQVKHYE